MKVLMMLLCVALVVCAAGCTTITPGKATTDEIGAAPVSLEMKVTVSTTRQAYEGEGPPAALIDGDRETRWASNYADGQKVVVDLGQEIKLSAVNLYWEKASAKDYAVSLSTDGETWASVQKSTDGKPGPRTDKVALKGRSARYIRLELTTRATEWGFSLYEIVPVPSK